MEELTMSQFASQKDYWKARAELAEKQRDELKARLDNIAAAASWINAKFKSGNSVPVERITLVDHEWAPLQEAIAKAEGEKHD